MKRMITFVLLVASVLAVGVDTGRAAGGPIAHGQRVEAAAQPRPRLPFAAPTAADEMAALAPAGAVRRAFPAGTAATRTEPDTATLLSFDRGRVGIYLPVEAAPAVVEYETVRARLAPADGTAPTEPLLTFALDVYSEMEAGAVRLMVDLRSLLPAGPPPGTNYFLSYQSPRDSSLWIDVPLAVHDKDGLISADVEYATMWRAGVASEWWTPNFSFPGVSEYSGAASYRYEISLPEGRNGLTPPMALQYSSRPLDGRIHTPDQVPAVADGWSLSVPSVVRDDVRMAQNSANQPAAIMPERFRLRFGGVGYRLAAAGSGRFGGTRYLAVGAPHLYLEKHDVTEDTTRQRIFWTVITGEGVMYRLGHDPNAVAYYTTSHEAHLVFTPDDLPYRKAGIAWSADLVVDTMGNQIRYDYLTRVDSEILRWMNSNGNEVQAPFSVHGFRLLSVRYNFPSIPEPNPHLSWPALPVPMGDAAVRVSLRASTGDDLAAGTYRQGIDRIYLFDGSAIRPLAEYRLDVVRESVNGACDTTTRTRVIRSIQQWARSDADPSTDDTQHHGAYALPATTLTYATLAHFYRNATGCFSYRYLSGVENGYGGSISFSYIDDGRTVGNYDHTPYYRLYPEVGLSYVVAEKQVRDGHNPPVRTTYAYQRPCYHQRWGVDDSRFAGARGCVETSYIGSTGSLLGFDRVTVTRHAHDGTRAGRSFTRFAQSVPHYLGHELLRGMPLYLEEEDAAGAVIRTRDVTYQMYVAPGGAPFFTPLRTTDHMRDPRTGITRSRVHESHHLPHLQGGHHFGNQTISIEHGNLRVTGDEKTTVRCFFPNDTGRRWLVTLPAIERIFAGVLPQTRLESNLCHPQLRADDLLQERRILYDGRGATNPYGADVVLPPLRGLVTQTVNGLPGAEATGTDYGLFAGERIEYDLYGNVVRVTSPAGAMMEIAYDNAFRLFPVSVTRRGPRVPDLQTTIELYGITTRGRSRNGVLMPLGSVATIRDPNGLENHYEYDPFGRLFAVYEAKESVGDVRRAWDGDPRQRFRYWDNDWNHGRKQLIPLAISTETRPGSLADKTGDVLRSAYTYYDGLGRVIQTRRHGVLVEGAQRDVVVLHNYDFAGREVCRSAPFAVHPDQSVITTPCADMDHARRTYDDQGRLWREFTFAGAMTEHLYRVTATGYYHDRIDPNGHRRTYQYDGLGQIVAVETYEGTCGHDLNRRCGAGETRWTPYAETRYTYSLLGQLLAVIDAHDNATEIQYDALQRRVFLNDPDLGIHYYGYDEAGRLEWQRTARGYLLCTTYDAYDRIVRKRSVAGNSCEETLDSTEWLASYEYDVQDDGTPALGMLTKTFWPPVGSNNHEAIFYDERMRPRVQRRVIDNVHYEMSVLAYDTLDRPLSMRYPGGEIVEFEYDPWGPQALTVDGYEVVEEALADVRGQLLEIRFGSGIQTHYDYRPASGDFRLSRLNVAGDDGTLLDLRYAYDAVGNVTRIDEYAPDREEDSSWFTWERPKRRDRQLFAYDHLNRLIEASGDRRELYYARTYDYDVLGNFTYIDAGRTGEPFEYGAAQPHAVTRSGDDEFGYDAHGNMVLRVQNGVRYEQHYDFFDRMIAVRKSEGVDTQVTTFAYADDSRRVKRVDGTGQVIHYPFPNVTVYDPQTDREVIETTFAFGGRAVAVSVQGGGRTGIYHLHTDHLGSAQLVTYGPGHNSIGSDLTGDPVSGSEARYLPFGEARMAPEFRLSEEGFTGHRAEPGLGLVYMNERYYVPSLGRFATADTMIPEPLDGQSLNRYSYVRNNPLRFVDPSGRCATVSVFDGTSMVEQPDPDDGECWEQYNYLRYEVGLSPDQIGYGHEYEARSKQEFTVMRTLYEQHQISWTTLLARSWRIADDVPAGGNCLVPGVCLLGYSVLTIEHNGAEWTVQSRTAETAWETVYELRNIGQTAYVLESDAASFIEMVNSARSHFVQAFEHFLQHSASTIGAAVLLFIAIPTTAGSLGVSGFAAASIILPLIGASVWQRYQMVNDLTAAFGFVRDARNEFLTLTRYGPDYSLPPAFLTVP